MFGASIILALRGVWGAIPGSVKIGTVAAVAALLAAWAIHHHGVSQGRQEAAVSALETSVRVLKERNQIDATISHSDAAALCDDFGLPDDQRDECMRRLETPPAKP